MIRSSIATAVVAVLSTACMTTSSSHKANESGVELRYDTNEATFISESSGRVYMPGEYVTFDGFYADGEKLPDELDFYTIIDDKEHIDGIVKWRETHNRAILYSWLGVGVGAVLVGGGVAALYVLGGGEGDALAAFAATPAGQGTFAAIGVGGILLGGGGMAYFLFGPSPPLSGEGGYDPGLLYPTSESDALAQAYMAKRSATPDGGAPPAEAPAAPAEPAPAQ